MSVRQRRRAPSPGPHREGGHAGDVDREAAVQGSEVLTPGSTERAGGLIVVSLVLFVYMRTMYRSVPGGDSGELIVAGCTAGIAHPPGYPLFTMLAIALHALPLGGTPAWRINLLSVLLASASAWFNYWTVVHWDGGIWAGKRGEVLGGGWTPAFWKWSLSVWAGMASALLLSFCPLIWMYSIQAEVFALNNLCVSLLTYLAVLFHQRRQLLHARLGALAIGLGLSNQHTLLFYAVPLVVFMLHLEPRLLLRPPAFASLVACGLLGLTPYIYLPLAGHKAAFGAWGEVDTWEGFATHFLRREYGTFRLFSGNEASQMGDQLVEALLLYCKNLQLESSLYVGAPLSLLGLGLCGVEAVRERSSKGFGAGVALMLAFYMVVFHCLSNLPLDQALYFEVHKRFWMQAHILVFGFIGVGFGYLGRLTEDAVGRVAARALGATCTAVLVSLQVGLDCGLMGQGPTPEP